MYVEEPSVSPRATGGSVLTGVVPAAAPVELLGPREAVMTGHPGQDALDGTAPIILTLDRGGNLARVRASGAEIDFEDPGAIPAGLRDQIRGTTYRTTYTGVGGSVPIAVPSTSEDLSGTFLGSGPAAADALR